MNIFDRSLFMVAGKVAGVQLSPLSAYQTAALILLDSPYLNGDDSSVSWGDTVSALIILSSGNDGLNKVIGFQNKSGIRALWRMRLFVRNHKTIVSQLKAHVATYFDYPEVWEVISSDGGKSSKSGAPWVYFLISVIWQATGRPLDELWDMPLIVLSCHKAIRDELNGGAEIGTSLIEEREKNKAKQNG